MSSRQRGLYVGDDAVGVDLVASQIAADFDDDYDDDDGYDVVGYTIASDDDDADVARHLLTFSSSPHVHL